MARTQIQSVTPGGPAHQAGVRPGETLVAINGHPIVDVLDYKYYSYDPDLHPHPTAPKRGSGTVRAVAKTWGRTWAWSLPPTSWTGPGPAPTTACSALWTRCRQACGTPSISRTTTPGCPSSWATTLPSPTSASGSCSGSVDLHISPINISVHATDPEVRAPSCWATSGAGESAWSIMRTLCPGGDRDELPDCGLPGPQRRGGSAAKHGGVGGPLSPGEERVGGSGGPDPPPPRALPPAALHRKGRPKGWWTRWRPSPAQCLAENREPDLLVLRRVLPPGRDGPCRRTTSTRSTPSWKTAWGCSACWKPESEGRRGPDGAGGDLRPWPPFPSPPGWQRPLSWEKSLTERRTKCHTKLDDSVYPVRKPLFWRDHYGSGPAHRAGLAGPAQGEALGHPGASARKTPSATGRRVFLDDMTVEELSAGSGGAGDPCGAGRLCPV